MLADAEAEETQRQHALAYAADVIAQARAIWSVPVRRAIASGVSERTIAQCLGLNRSTVHELLSRSPDTREAAHRWWWDDECSREVSPEHISVTADVSPTRARPDAYSTVGEGPGASGADARTRDYAS